MSSSGSSARNPWATPVGMTTQSSAASSRVSTSGAALRSVEHRPDVDEGDERATARHDPVVELAAVEVEAAQDAGRRRRQVGLDEGRPRAGAAASPVDLEASPATARGTSPARRHGARRRRSGRPAAIDGGAVEAHRRRARRRPQRGRARSRPSRPARRAAARPTAAASAPGRPSAAAARRAPRSTPGTFSTVDVDAGPPDDVARPQSARVAISPLTR